MSHIETARSDGARAGFNAYVATLERVTSNGTGGLEANLDALDELRGAGNKKAQFTFYCEKFGHKWADKNGRATAARQEHDDDEVSELQERLARLLGRGRKPRGIQVVEGEDEDDEDEVEAAPKPRRRTRKPATRKTASVVGIEFLYHGKNGDSTWTVERLGKTKKHGKPAYICSNGKREAAWNVKSFDLYVKNGQIELIS